MGIVGATLRRRRRVGTVLGWLLIVLGRRVVDGLISGRSFEGTLDQGGVFSWRRWVAAWRRWVRAWGRRGIATWWGRRSLLEKSGTWWGRSTVLRHIGVVKLDVLDIESIRNVWSEGRKTALGAHLEHANATSRQLELQIHRITSVVEQHL